MAAFQTSSLIAKLARNSKKKKTALEKIQITTVCLGTLQVFAGNLKLNQSIIFCCLTLNSNNNNNEAQQQQQQQRRRATHGVAYYHQHACAHSF